MHVLQLQQRMLRMLCGQHVHVMQLSLRQILHSSCVENSAGYLQQWSWTESLWLMF